jgi:hypothetical protein
MRSLFNKYISLFLLFSVAVITTSWTFNGQPISKQSVQIQKIVTPKIEKSNSRDNDLYAQMNLEGMGLSWNAFETAMNGFKTLNEKGVLQNDSIITIIDFNQPSYNKRLYVLDIKNDKILFNTYVAHGKNSGREWAYSFSNKMQSEKSSLGFYVTEEVYSGSNGYSLKLMGLEKNINDNALQRGIVLHGANYVSNRFINSEGYIGRSHGCPAVPRELTKPIISTIKGGTCLFIYHKMYNALSSFASV